MRRPIALVAVVVLLVSAPAPTAAAQEQRASLPDIEDEVMCPICGTALGLSESPQANAEREFIRELIAKGRTKEEIKQALVDEYGSEVLATPEASGFDLAAWIVPVAGLLVAGAAIGIGVHRWRARSEPAGAEDPRLTGPDPDDEERLRADLRRYEL
jgi:cytochrome c-type biogenesis protein CcmH